MFSENSVIAIEEVYDETVKFLSDEGGLLLNKEGRPSHLYPLEKWKNDHRSFSSRYRRNN